MENKIQSIYLAVSDGDGILEIGGLGRDLADAIIAYAQGVGLPVSEAHQADGGVWYEFETPPENRRGGLGAGQYDKIVSAAENRWAGFRSMGPPHVERSVREALRRLSNPVSYDPYDEGAAILDTESVGPITRPVTMRYHIARVDKTLDFAGGCDDWVGRDDTTHEVSVRATHQIIAAFVAASEALRRVEEHEE